MYNVFVIISIKIQTIIKKYALNFYLIGRAVLLVRNLKYPSQFVINGECLILRR
jgi:hypothetical protein